MARDGCSALEHKETEEQKSLCFFLREKKTYVDWIKYRTNILGGEHAGIR